MRFWGSILLAMLWLVPAMAHASGDRWVVLDLGSSRTEGVCVDAAAQAFMDYSRVFGVRRMARGRWTVYGYGMEKQEIDAIVTCTLSTANATRATLVLYADNQITARMIAARYEGIFATHNKLLGAAWLKRALERNNM